MSKGYKGFGSFHSDNVETLLASDVSEVVPPIPDSVKQVIEKHTQIIQHGNMAKSAFMIDFNRWKYLNHGAFGSATRFALEVHYAWEIYAESQILRWIDRELFPYIVIAIKRMAKFVSGDAKRLVFCPNATTAINAVVRWNVKQEDVVFCLDVGYGSVKTLLKSTCELVGAKFVLGKLDTTKVGNANDILEQVKTEMPKDTTFAVFDHVTSNTAIVMPIKELVEYSHSLGAKVLIDGAHGLGTFDLNLDEIKAEWYAGNCHKWLSSTKGVGMLYVQPNVKERTRALVVSHGWNSGFTEEFIWDGTRDYTGIVTMPSLLDWWESCVKGGLEGSRDYCRGLLRDAVTLLSEKWNTKTHVSMDLYAQMACVAIPKANWPFDRPADSEQAKIIQDALHYQYFIECPVKVLDGGLYVRISAQIYNSIEEYQTLADVISNLYWKDGELIQ